MHFKAGAVSGFILLTYTFLHAQVFVSPSLVVSRFDTYYKFENLIQPSICAGYFFKKENGVFLEAGTGNSKQRFDTPAEQKKVKFTFAHFEGGVSHGFWNVSQFRFSTQLYVGWLMYKRDGYWINLGALGNKYISSKSENDFYYGASIKINYPVFEDVFCFVKPGLNFLPGNELKQQYFIGGGLDVRF